MMHYLEDLHPGQKFGTARLKVDAARIKCFAAEFDPQPFHLEESAAEKSLSAGQPAGLDPAKLTFDCPEGRDASC